MFIIIRHMTKAFGLFVDEQTALQYGMAEWADGNFTIHPLSEVLDDLGLSYTVI